MNFSTALVDDEVETLDFVLDLREEKLRADCFSAAGVISQAFTSTSKILSGSSMPPSQDG